MEQNKYFHGMKQKWTILTAFFILFLLFFIQYPLQGSLTGNLDTIANLAMYKQIKLYIDSWFTGNDFGSLCYPLENVIVYFGADFGAGIIHVLFNYLGMSDIWANWMFIAIVFTLNSFALFLLLNLYLKDEKIAFAGSLIFNLSHFTLANLENPNALFFFFFFLSLYFYEVYLSSKGENLKVLFKAAVLGCIQIYLSPYLFLFHCIVWFILILFREPKLFSKIFFIKYIKITLLYLIIISPFLYFFVFNSAIDSSKNSIFEEDYTFLFSLNIPDFTRVLPHHLYKNYIEIFDNPFLSKIKAAFLGYAFYIIAIYGWIKTRQKWMWLLIAVVGIIIAIGPFLVLDMNNMKPFIMYPFYKYGGMGDILRVPSRAFFITVFAGTIMISFALKSLNEKFQNFPIWMILCIIILLENVPLRMEVYDQKAVLHPEKVFMQYLNNHPESITVSVPTQLGNYLGDRNEYIYMYWQHIHKRTILNGNLAFIPEARLKTDATFKDLNSYTLTDLIRSHDITTIAYHKDLPQQNLIQLDSLKSFTFLQKQVENERVAIFEVIQPLP
jgi:hypothetical protein